MKHRIAFCVSAIAGMTLAVTSSFANLLGVSVELYPRITYQATSTSGLTYTPTNQLLTITALPTAIQFSSAETARPISGARSLTINVLVDNAGNLVGGVSGADFTLSGNVTRIVGGVTNIYSGVLLTGEVAGFGFLESGPTDQFDFRFNVTGGALSSFFSCGDIGVIVINELSTFSGSFSANFNGRPKGTVVLEDLIPPTVTCPTNITVECNTNNLSQRGAYVAFPNPVGTDNCDTNLTFVYTPPSGSFFALATPGPNSTNYVVTLTATDASGNQSSCTFTVVVQDTLPPQFDNDSPIIGECGAQPLILTNDAGQCYATFTFITPTATNLCCLAVHSVTNSAVDENGDVIILSDNGNGTETGHFPVTCVGSNVITIVAADDHGNSTNRVCLVYVVDNEPPVITCASNQTVECTGGPINFEEPIASDNCPNLTISCMPTNGSVLGIGTHQIVYTASDCSGNTNQCTFDVIVQDTTPPTISCPSNVTVECGQSTDPSSTGTATASDTCDANPTVTFTDAVSGTWPQIITRTWKATDASSNSVTCVQTITIQDTTPPVISCPPDKQLQCGDSTDPSNTGMATATDTCSTTVTISYTDAAGLANCTGKPGIDRTWKATDAAGNSSTCVQHITYVDTTAPTVTVPAGSNLGCNPATLPTDASLKALVTATDNCGVPTVNVSHVDANSGCVVTRTFTVTATDGCGNISAAQTVVYNWTADTTPPTITAVPTGSNLGCNPATLPTDASVKALVTATDNCSVPTVTVSHVDANSGCAVTRTFTVTATDGCGNTSAAKTVVYNWTADTTPPTITAVPTGSNLGCNPASLPTDASVKALVTASDNCGVPTVNVSHVDTNNGCAVTRTFTVTATDGCGNTSAAQTVVYSWTADTTPPSITCPAPVTVQCASNVPPANVASVTASDNCGTVTVSFVGDVVTNQTCPNRYTVLRTYKAVNACGNSATCTQTITVNDTTKPSITCPTNITVSALSLCTNAVPATNPTIAAFLHGVTATDNCGGSATVTNNAPSTFLLGTNTVTFTATDSCGNTNKCQASVIVMLMPVNCEPIQFVPFFCQHHFDGFGRSQFATLEGNITLPNGDQPCDFRTAAGTFVAVTVTVGTNAPVLVYCKSQNHTVQSDGCGGEAWEYFGNNNYERAIYRFTDNQCYNSLIDPKLPSSSATGNRNCGALSTVSIGATSTRFYYGFQQARQPITVVCDGIVLLSVSNNVASSPFPFSQSGKTIQCTFPERLVPGNVVQWYATSDPTKVSSNNLIYTQQTSATGNSTATYYNDGGSCEFQVPTGGLNFNSNDRSVCVQVMIGQPGVSAKVGCFTFCQPLNGMGNQDWQYGQCSSFQDEFEEESDDDWGTGNW